MARPVGSLLKGWFKCIYVHEILILDEYSILLRDEFALHVMFAG